MHSKLIQKRQLCKSWTRSDSMNDAIMDVTADSNRICSILAVQCLFPTGF